MRYATKYFGEVEIPKEKLINFTGAIYGFEELREYFIIHFEQGNDGMLCLQSAQDEGLAFILFNPYYIMPSYEPKISEEDFKLIHADKDDELLVYVIAVIKESGEVTV
ncbi:MAG: flagellar assembly protein FliW, partial [Oscillospiraceae bacterium]